VIYGDGGRKAEQLGGQAFLIVVIWRKDRGRRTEDFFWHGFHGLRGFGFLLLREKFSVSRKGAKALRKEGNHK
jgi:hypothetical protein